MVVATCATVAGASEELSRGEARQAEALSTEVRLVGVPGVDGQARHAIRTAATGGTGVGLCQRKTPLNPQRPL